MENNNKNFISKKLSTILLIVGAVLLVVGIVLDVLAESFIDTDNLFESNIQAFDIMSTFGWVAIVAGLIMMFVGALPYIVKLFAKLGKETLDTAGEDIKEVTTKGVETFTPATQKTIKVFKDAIVDKTADEKTQEEQKEVYCRYCGAKIDTDAKFCSNCGKEQDNN